MPMVKINLAGGLTTVNVSVDSVKVCEISISVYASDGTTRLEHYISDSQTNNPYKIILPKNPSQYGNCYITGIFSVIDIEGPGNTYSILFSLQQNNSDIPPTITMVGITSQGTFTHSGTFQIMGNISSKQTL